MYDYTTKEEKLDARFQACREEYEAEIRKLFEEGFGGNTSLSLPRVKYINKPISFNGFNFYSGEEVIVYDQSFPDVIGDCVQSDNAMAYLLAANEPGADVSGTLAVFRAECVAVYLKENLDDIVRCAWDRRDCE